jgi:hypothetical protein
MLAPFTRFTSASRPFLSVSVGPERGTLPPCARSGSRSAVRAKPDISSTDQISHFRRMVRRRVAGLRQSRSAGSETEWYLEAKRGADILGPERQRHGSLSVLRDLQQRRSEFAAHQRLAPTVRQKRRLGLRGRTVNAALLLEQDRAWRLRVHRIGRSGDDRRAKTDEADPPHTGLRGRLVLAYGRTRLTLFIHIVSVRLSRSAVIDQDRQSADGSELFPRRGRMASISKDG